MSVFYINQVYLSYKDKKKVYYCNYFLLGQVSPCLNSSEDFENFECQPNEAKMYHSKYDTVTGEFLGLIETLGYVTVRGDRGECFLGYGYAKENSKIL